MTDAKRQHKPAKPKPGLKRSLDAPSPLESKAVENVMQRLLGTTAFLPPPVIEPTLVTEPEAVDTEKVDHKIDHDLISDQPKIEESPITPVTVNPAHNEPSSLSPAHSEPSSPQSQLIMNPVHNEPSSQLSLINLGAAKSYRVPNYIDDELMPTLSTTEQAILRRLYRLSYGFNRQTTAPVSIPKLAEKCNISEASVKRGLKVLEDRGLIKIHVDQSFNPKGGNTYSVLTGLIMNPAHNEPSSQRAQLIMSHINDHDDLLKEHDHHQAETMMIYQSITGNPWSKADLTAYQKIRNIPLDAIEQGIRVATARAASRPGSLAYFVKEITQIANPSPASRAQRRRELQQIIERVKTAHLGQVSYSMADFSADVKDMCAREGVVFDYSLFNEIVG